MHKSFAKIYDEFMDQVDYTEWYQFLKKYTKKGYKILDLGSGTGILSDMFYKDGYDVTGVDISKDMIEVSQGKNSNIRYIQFDITNVDLVSKLDNKYDFIMCNFDTINYISNKNKLEILFNNCNNLLNEKGIMIFDIVSEDIFEEIFINDLFIDSTDNYTNIWYHLKEEDKHIVDMELFIKEENGLFRKYTEKHNKYIYEIEDVVDILYNNGFEIYDTATNPEYGESRYFFIIKKVGNYER